MYLIEGGAIRQKIAVIGGGISGMGAAYHLAERNDVTLFEAEGRLGGHARTKVAGVRGDQPVDTGFIVFNYANYPHLVRLFEELDVPVVKSNMSFGASIGGGRIEYGLASVNAVLAQKRNALRPGFVRMIMDILKFNREAVGVADCADMTIGDLLAKLGTGAWFRDYYLLPLSGAIWSTPTEKILDFPARAMIQFFENHALLGYYEQHQWYTVEGGSIEYVKRLEAGMSKKGVTLRQGAPIDAVRRTHFGAEVKTAGAEWEKFDAVVMATHSDDSLRMLSDATGVERTALSAIRYQPNKVVLHGDSSIMPKKKLAWASWVYTEANDKASDQIDLTYWMNSLQPIPHDDPMFVTLNTTRPIREDLIYDETVLRHPVYDLAAFAAQDTMRAINGQNATWFCGAWMKNGFHEDGLSSAMDVVEGIEAQAAMRLAAE